MKRAFVPTALHAELTEYANLVRVLRTTRILDLTAHLLPQNTEPDADADTDTDPWTSWPLIDCPVPEWSLDDEIRLLGESVARAARAHNPDSPNSDSDSDREDLSHAAANHIVLHTGALLVHILDLLADQRPSAPGSMQNRLSPMNWEDVISLLAVAGHIHPAILSRAHTRLERIYGPSSTKAIDRLDAATSAKARSANMASVDEDQFAAPPLLRTHRNVKASRAHKSGVKSSAVVHSDTGADSSQTSSDMQ